MSNLKEYKLDDVFEIIKDSYHPNNNETLNYIGLEHIEQEALRLNSIGKSTDVTSNKYRFLPNDILFGKLRCYFRKVVKPNFDGICSTDIWVCRAKENFDQNFLFYFLANWDFINTADNGEGGTRMPRADWDFLKNTIWNFPDKKYQISIASILSSLDDKINLLQSQNKTLEQLAETMFRQWFVEDENNNINSFDKLGNIFDIGIGRTPPRKEQHWFTTNPADIKWISIKDLGNGGIYIDSTAEYLTNEAITHYIIPVIPVNTVLLSFKMTIGRLGITTEEMLSNEAIAHFKQKPKSQFFPEFLYLFLKSFKFESLGSTSSIVESINSQMIKEIEIPIPDNQKLSDFKKVIEPYFGKIKNNSRQIQTLSILRDTLLPKLMNGEINLK